MNQEKRHEVTTLMKTVHKEAGNVAVSALTKAVMREVRGFPGGTPEVYKARTEKALTLVEGALAVAETVGLAVKHELFEAEALLNEALAEEPEAEDKPYDKVEEFFGGMLAMPKVEEA